MKTNILKKLSVVLLFAMSPALFACGDDDKKDEPTASTTDTTSVTPSEQQSDAPKITTTFTAMDIAKNMYPGWNLGNTLEASGTGLNCETEWQSTVTTQEIIDFVKTSGFKSVRIPCSWYIHLSDANSITIDKEWINRVKEVVDYCINDGLYVLLNDHYDSGWLEVLGYSNSTSTYSEVGESLINAKINVLKKIWTQIANEFKNYDGHLIFAGQNEPFQNYDVFDKNLSNKATTLSPILNRYNQAFVDAVRATGGNNANRILTVQAPGADMWGAQNTAFVLPTDTRENGLMLEFHYYNPWNFAGGSGEYYWGADNKADKYYVTYATDESYVKSEFAKMKTKYADKGIPMLIGEYGANWRDLSGVSDADQDKHDASIKAWFKAISQYGPESGMIPMVWDINSPNQNGTIGTMTVIDRANLKIFCKPAFEGITEGTAAASWPY